jgi:GntR family transcriptional regulator
VKPLNFEIDITDGIPLYRQIEEAIRQKIENQVLKPGDLLPSEKDLESSLGISRAPIRQAISRLVQDGYLSRKSGKGTFVSKKHSIRRDLPRLASFTEEMKAQGIIAGSKTISVGFAKMNSSNKWLFKELQDNRVLAISRLRLVEGKPVCLMHSYFPARLGASEGDDFSGSIYELLEKKYRISIVYGEELITATVADPEQARLLEVAEGSPLISIWRTTFSEAQNPIEVTNNYYRADRFYFTVRLERHSPRKASPQGSGSVLTFMRLSSANTLSDRLISLPPNAGQRLAPRKSATK